MRDIKERDKSFISTLVHKNYFIYDENIALWWMKYVSRQLLFVKLLLQKPIGFVIIYELLTQMNQ